MKYFITNLYANESGWNVNYRDKADNEYFTVIDRDIKFAYLSNDEQDALLEAATQAVALTEADTVPEVPPQQEVSVEPPCECAVPATTAEPPVATATETPAASAIKIKIKK